MTIGRYSHASKLIQSDFGGQESLSIIHYALSVIFLFLDRRHLSAPRELSYVVRNSHFVEGQFTLTFKTQTFCVLLRTV